MGTPRTVLVAGGAGGIGSAVCERLHRGGYDVVVGDLDPERTASVAESVGGHGLSLDVCDPDSVDAAFREASERNGRLWAVVNAVGWDRLVPFVDTSEEFTRKVLDINLVGAIRLVRAGVKALIDGGSGGRIVTLASDAGRVGSSGESVYSAAKGGVIALSKSVAREMARDGITVNCVCPGPTDTPLLSDMFEGSGERLLASLQRAIPMGRIGTGEDVAAAVAYLVAADAGFVTGQTLSVSGGLTMQ